MTEKTEVVVVHAAGPEDAAEVLEMIRSGFGARPLLDPPSTALEESLDSVARALTTHGGLLAVADTGPVGALLFDPQDRMLGVRRVAVYPSAQGMGVAGALVEVAEDRAVHRGYDGICLTARAELPATIQFWSHLRYDEVERAGTTVTMAKMLPVDAVADTSESARALGKRVAGILRPGDLVILTGDLGAGKTTFTQGVGAGLQVRGDVTSPTFVISRVHPSLVGGPALVHVDAYRLGGMAELDDLDLDTALEDAVTVVEWGEGVAESLTASRLQVTITRPRGDEVVGEDDDVRHLRFTPVGARWIGSGLREALA